MMYILLYYENVMKVGISRLGKSGSYINGRKMKRHSLVELGLGNVLHITNNTAGDDLDAEVGWRVADASNNRKGVGSIPTVGVFGVVESG